MVGSSSVRAMTPSLLEQAVDEGDQSCDWQRKRIAATRALRVVVVRAWAMAAESNDDATMHGWEGRQQRGANGWHRW
ncbi:hypothetical protein BHM03_00052399 [Ensete ventricosum]|nr:hypothetical protein BHM03_00052399 [Ensete ventricosum]